MGTLFAFNVYNGCSPVNYRQEVREDGCGTTRTVIPTLLIMDIKLPNHKIFSFLLGNIATNTYDYFTFNKNHTINNGNENTD